MSVVGLIARIRKLLQSHWVFLGLIIAFFAVERVIRPSPECGAGFAALKDGQGSWVCVQGYKP